jgi:hypothetical protein
VAEGLKTGNGKGPILSECLVAVSLYKSIAAGLLWVVSRKNQNHRRAVQSLSYHTIKSRSAVGSKKKIPVKKKAVATTTRSTCDWSAEILTKAKGSERKKEIRNEFIIILG